MKALIFRQKVILMLMGCIVFTDLCSFISQDLLHLPLSAPELLLCPFVPFLRRYYFFNKISAVKFATILISWLTLLILGILSTNYSFLGIISNARAWLLLFFICFLVYKNCNFYLNSVFYVGIGGLLGWLYMAYINLRVTLLEENVVYGPMLFIPVVLGYLAINRRILLFLIFSSICILIGIMSGIRRCILITIITNIFIIFILAYYNRKSLKKYLSAFAGLSIGILCSLPIIVSYTYATNPYIYDRIFKRTDAAISGNKTDGDLTRENNIKKLFKTPEKFLLPHGFVSKHTSKDAGTGIFIDLPLTEFLQTLGLLGTIILFGILLSYVRVLSKRIRRGKVSQYDSILILSFFIMTVLLFMEGTFLTFPMYTLITGYIIGSIFRESYTTKKTNFRIQ